MGEVSAHAHTVMRNCTRSYIAGAPSFSILLHY